MDDVILLSSLIQEIGHEFPCNYCVALYQDYYKQQVYRTHRQIPVGLFIDIGNNLYFSQHLQEENSFINV